MKIQYLGTGAAEGIPAMFCACPACKNALKAGGRNIMTRPYLHKNRNYLLKKRVEAQRQISYT